MTETERWEASLANAKTMPSCPKCGGKMEDASAFTVSGAKCTVCDFSYYEAPIM